MKKAQLALSYFKVKEAKTVINQLLKNNNQIKIGFTNNIQKITTKKNQQINILLKTKSISQTVTLELILMDEYWDHLETETIIPTDNNVFSYKYLYTSVPKTPNRKN